MRQIITLLCTVVYLLATATVVSPVESPVYRSSTSLTPVTASGESNSDVPESIDGLTLTMVYTLTNNQMSVPYSSEVSFKTIEGENQYEMTGFMAEGVFDDTVKVLPLKVSYIPENGQLLIPCNQIAVIYMGNEFSLYNIHEGDEQLTEVPLVFEYNEKGGFNWLSTIPVTDGESGELIDYTSVGGFIVCIDKFQWIYRVQSPSFEKTNGTFSGTFDVSGEPREVSQTVSVDYSDNTLSVRNWIGTNFETTIILTVDSETQTVCATDAYVAEDVRLSASDLDGNMAEANEYKLTGHYTVNDGHTRVEFPSWSAFDAQGFLAYYQVSNSVLEFDIPLPTGSGISTIGYNENQEAEYYTIDGFKVSTPSTPGIYLVRKGDKIERIDVCK